MAVLDLATIMVCAAVMVAGVVSTIVLLRSHPATRVDAVDVVSLGKGTSDWLPTLLGALFVLGSSVLVGSEAYLVASVLLGCLLLALSIFDIRALILPNVLTLSVALSGLAITAHLMPERLIDHVLGVVAGFIALVAIDQIYRMVRGRAGLGMGDAKLLGAAGAWVSWSGLSNVVLIGAASALIYGLLVGFLTRRPLRDERVPFGAFLCLGIWLTWLVSL